MNTQLSPILYAGLWHNVQSKYLSEVYLSDHHKAEFITSLVCDDLKIDLESVKSKCRKRELVEARQISMYFIKAKTILPLKKIGAIFLTDHSTVIYAIQTVNDMIDTDKSFKAKIARIASSITHMPNTNINEAKSNP